MYFYAHDCTNLRTVYYKAGILVNLIFMHNLPPSCQACELSGILASLQMEIYWMNCSHNELEAFLKSRLNLSFHNRKCRTYFIEPIDLKKNFVTLCVLSSLREITLLAFYIYCSDVHYNGAKKNLNNTSLQNSYFLRRPLKLTQSPNSIWNYLVASIFFLRFGHILLPSQNIWTLSICTIVFIFSTLNGWLVFEIRIRLLFKKLFLLVFH